MKKLFFLLFYSVAFVNAAELAQNTSWDNQKQDYYNWVKKDVTGGMPDQQQSEILNNLKTSLDNNTFNINDFSQYYNDTLQKNQGSLSSWLDNGGNSSPSLLSSSASCACAAGIQQSFADMKSYIINDKFPKLSSALLKWEQSIDANIAEQKAKNALIKQNIEQNARKSFYYQKLIYQYQKGNLIE